MKKIDFLNFIEAFLQRNSLKASAFGLKVMGDGSFVWRVRHGRECREETQEKVLWWMEDFERKESEKHDC